MSISKARTSMTTGSTPARSASLPIERDDGAEIAKLQQRIDVQAHEITTLKRERESLRKLVIGMAMARHGFDPKVARSKTVTKIADDLRVTGVPLDEGTILNALRRGAELLPPED
jgi:hypothetical protein